MSLWMRRRALAAVGTAPCLATRFASSVSASPRIRPGASTAVRLALIGDVPYGAREEARLLKVFEHIAGRADLTLHVGDLKGSSEPCSNALLERRIALLDRCPTPLVFVPGDNDWLDCWRDRAGAFDPHDRLEWLRRRIFSGSPPYLGSHAAPVTGLSGIEQHTQTEGGPPENLRWRAGGALWLTLNLPGSNNGLSASIADDHRLERDRWNRRWLESGLEQARASGQGAIVVAVQANPRFERAHARSVHEDGYTNFRQDLLRIQRAFGRPMMLLHGDTHRFRHDWITPGLLRVECFGSPFAESWVRIRVDASAEDAFSVAVEHL